MCRKQIYSAVFVLVVIGALTAGANAAWPGLVGHWRLDEGIGTTAGDASGNGNSGTLNGGAQWTTGKIDGGVYLDGTDDYIEIPNILSEIGTIAFWFKPDWDGSDPEDYRLFDASTSTIYFLISKGANHADINPEDFGFYLEDGTDADYQGIEIDPSGVITAGIWFHVAVTWEFSGGPAILYLDGQEIARADTLGPFPALHANPRFGLQTIDYIPSANGAMSVIDDIMIFDKVLMAAEIPVIMQGLGQFPYAWNPNPLDGTLINDTWISLSWSPGDFAVSHDVYLGDSFDSVNDATNESETFRINQVGTFYVAGFPGYAYPDGLIPGTTYYWRIDEVNEANPDSPWKGPIWSFSVPPKTAYHPNPADGAEFVDPNNARLSWTPGFGAKLHTVYFGDDYDTVYNAEGGLPAGLSTYNPGPLELEKVYYWRVDEFDAVQTYKGDVWCFTTPGAVGNPQPRNGDADVGINAILRWTPADSAASHQLYFGTDKETVRNADAASPESKGSIALGSESYDPGLLEAETNYYWRVDEVDSQGNTAKGPLWIFTTGGFLLVDDFEGYTDDDVAGEAIWQHWIDGFGVADNGAQVGYLMPPYAEQTIVHSGAQSMPLWYTNEAGVTNSEASLTLTAPRDWTQAGVAELSLWFRGNIANAADPLYVSIANSEGSPAVAPHEDPDAAIINTWTQWVIPLQTFADLGINLTNVDKLMIGLGSKPGMAAPGGSGTMYIDDIRLY
jgi:hypothetical protein